MSGYLENQSIVNWNRSYLKLQIACLSMFFFMCFWIWVLVKFFQVSMLGSELREDEICRDNRFPLNYVYSTKLFICFLSPPFTDTFLNLLVAALNTECSCRAYQWKHWYWSGFHRRLQRVQAYPHHACIDEFGATYLVEGLRCGARSY